MKQESQMSQQNSRKQKQDTSLSYRLTRSEIDSMDQHLNAELWDLWQKGRFKPEECDPPYYPVPPEEWGIVQTDHLDPEDPRHLM